MKKRTSTRTFGLVLAGVIFCMTFSFDVAIVRAQAIAYIRADGSVDPPTAPILRIGDDSYRLTGNIDAEEAEASGLFVERDNMTLDGNGYDINGVFWYGEGIKLGGRTNVTIGNVTILGFVTGIMVTNSSNITLSGNTLYGNIEGTAFRQTRDCNITGNTLAQHEEASLYFDTDSGSRISQNNLTDSGIGVSIHNCTTQYVFDNDISAQFDSGMKTWISNHTSISGNNLTGNNVGVYLGLNSEDSVLSRNSIKNSSIALNIVEGSNHNVITVSNITENSLGVYIDSADSNSLMENTIAANTNEGIYLNTSSSNNILRNNITGNQYGIRLRFSSQTNSIRENNITANSQYGISLYSQSSDNTIQENSITGSYYGIWTGSSAKNTILHNNFINNTHQSYVFNSTNKWDNGCEGNYWSNYNGTDLDNDGVGDTNLPWEGVDNYPLMNRYWISADINHDLKVDMKDIGKAARAFNTAPGDLGWNPHADITGPEKIPDDRVDMRDISLIARHFGEATYAATHFGNHYP